MKVWIESEHLNGIKVIAHEFWDDQRGFFLEAYRADLFAELGIRQPFLQDNHSRSARGVVRGLHFQWDAPMAKLMRVTVGRAFLVAVDIRRNSPTLGQWFGVELAAEQRKQVFAPPGFARGFCALSDFVEIQYKCTAIYNPPCESGIRWNDPAVGISWPVEHPVLSRKDAEAQTLAQWLARPESDTFRYEHSGT